MLDACTTTDMELTTEQRRNRKAMLRVLREMELNGSYFDMTNIGYCALAYYYRAHPGKRCPYDSSYCPSHVSHLFGIGEVAACDLFVLDTVRAEDEAVAHNLQHHYNRILDHFTHN